MKKLSIKLSGLIVVALPISFAISCGNEAKTEETKREPSDVQHIVDEIKSLGTKLIERSETEFKDDVIIEKIAESNDLLNLGLNNLFKLPTEPDGIKIKIKKKKDSAVVSFKVTSSVTQKAEYFDVEFTKFTDIRDVVKALGQIKTSSLTEAAFKAKEVAWTNSSVLATVLSDLGITYTPLQTPPGLTIQVNKKPGELKVAYKVTSTLDNKGQSPLVTFDTFS